MDDDIRLQVALARYQAIAPYIADPPPRGARLDTLQRLAARPLSWPDGSLRQYRAETLRDWVKRYNRGGLEALKDAARAKPGTALPDAVLDKARALKQEVPERTLDTLLELLELSGTVEAGAVKRSTLHRALQAEGLSRRPATEDREDLDRFEADFPNALWQSDMLMGPLLPDPAQPEKMRRTWLYAFLDDHSRLLLGARFAFKGDLPTLELVLRRSLQRWGVPRRLYYDNGAVYRSKHMKRIAAMLGMQGIVFTKAYRPMGHGKIEAFNRYCKRNFIAEVKASRIRTLEELNEAMAAWARRYNERRHGETQQTPLERYRAGMEHVRFVDQERLRQAFLFSDVRKADKSGLFSLHTVRFQVPAHLANRRVEVRYDPDALDEVEVWHQDAFAVRLRPFEVQTHRRPKAEAQGESAPPAVEGFDKLGHLVEEDRKNGPPEPDPSSWRTEEQARREAQLQQAMALLREHLDAEVLDEPAVRVWWGTHGPLPHEAMATALSQVLDASPRDRHVTVLLDQVREVLR